MEDGHAFHPKHGFTGSASTSKEFRPNVPGFKRGTNITAGHKTHIPGESMDETGPIEGMPVTNMAHGGLSHIKSHKKNYSHGGRVEHDDHSKHAHPGYDKHGFEKGSKSHKE
jgi:hypothetical protein